MDDVFARATIVAAITAFSTWLILLRVLYRTGVPYAGLLAAVVSWTCAALLLLVIFDVLERTGW